MNDAMCASFYSPVSGPIANSGAHFAIFNKTKIWAPKSNGTISVTFKSDTFFSVNSGHDSTGTAGISLIGTDSNMVKPSMLIKNVDQPFGPFSIDGKNFNERITPFKSNCVDYAQTVDDCRISSDGAKFTAGETIIHEFCHSLGMMHEHQNDRNNPLVFNDLIYSFGGYDPNNPQDRQVIETNIIDKYCTSSNCDYVSSDFDRLSVMIYYIPDKYIKSGGPLYPNYKLSETDKQWLISMYPKDTQETDWPTLNIEFVDGSDEAWKKYWFKKVIIDNFVPIVGIHFTFSGLDNVDSEVIVPRSNNIIDLPKPIIYLLIALFAITMVILIVYRIIIKNNLR